MLDADLSVAATIVRPLRRRKWAGRTCPRSLISSRPIASSPTQVPMYRDQPIIDRYNELAP
ncbi:MAG: hypothetical protein R2838_07575 [Caldilineaceae bacterium]